MYLLRRANVFFPPTVVPGFPGPFVSAVIIHTPPQTSISSRAPPYSLYLHAHITLFYSNSSPYKRAAVANETSSGTSQQRPSAVGNLCVGATMKYFARKFLGDKRLLWEELRPERHLQGLKTRRAFLWFVCIIIALKTEKPEKYQKLFLTVLWVYRFLSPMTRVNSKMWICSGRSTRIVQKYKNYHR